MDSATGGASATRSSTGDPAPSRSRRLLRRIALGLAVLFILYPVSYVALRAPGVIRPRFSFENGLDEHGRWTTDAILRLQWRDTILRGEEDDPWAERMFVALYLPWAVLETVLRGEEWRRP